MSYDIRDVLMGDTGWNDGDYDDDAGGSGIELNEEERVALALPGLGAEGVYASNAGGDSFGGMQEEELETIMRQRYGPIIA
jgi:hypothetical protein